MNEVPLTDIGKKMWGSSGSIEQLIGGKKQSLTDEAHTALIWAPATDVALMLGDMYEDIQAHLTANDEQVFKRVRTVTDSWMLANGDRKADLLAALVDLGPENDCYQGSFLGYITFGPTETTWSLLTEQTNRFITQDQLTQYPGNIGIQRVNIILSILGAEWIGTQKRETFLHTSLFSDVDAVQHDIAPLLESPLLPSESKQMLAQIVAYHVEEPESLSPMTLFYAVGNHTGDGKQIDAAASSVLAKPEHSEAFAKLIENTPIDDHSVWRAIEHMRWGDKAHIVPLIMKKFVESDFSVTYPVEERLNILETFAGLVDRTLVPLSMAMPADIVTFREGLKQHINDELLGNVFDTFISRWEEVAGFIADSPEDYQYNEYTFTEVADVIKKLWGYGGTRESFYSQNRVNKLAAFLIQIQRYPRDTFNFWHHFDSVVLDVVDKLRSNQG